jgi:hypothetical protein
MIPEAVIKMIPVNENTTNRILFKSKTGALAQIIGAISSGIFICNLSKR